MLDDDREVLSRVLFAYENLWIEAMKYKFLAEHPDADPMEVQEKLVDQAHSLFHPIIHALRDGKPLQELAQGLLQTVDRPM